LQFLEYLVLFENKIRYTLGILKAYKALNIPQIDTEVNPAETCPSPSCRRSSSDKIQPCPKPFTRIQPYKDESVGTWPYRSGINREQTRCLSLLRCKGRRQTRWSTCRRPRQYTGNSGRRSERRLKLLSSITYYVNHYF